VLGVPREATDKQIRDAFRSLALKYHPDRNKAPEAQEKFKEIAAAYAVLSDPDKRRDYDRHGFAGVAGFSEEDLFRNVDFGDLFGGLNFDFPGMDMGLGGGLFERFFGRHRAGPRRGENIEVQLRVPLERIACGGEEKLHYARPVTCDACHGSGARAGTQPRPCATCGGSGRLTRESRQRRGKDEVRVQNITVCPDCGGAGTVIDQPCPNCGGRGRVEREETLTVNVPVGVEEGMALRIPGHGLPSEVPGGAPGDLFVIVHSAADPRFERAGADLWRSETLSIPEAVLGTTRRVPTLEAEVEVTIPPGTQPESVLRLAGQGLPEFGGRGRGDLYLRLRLSVPQQLTANERTLYEQLRALERSGAARGRH
jgi:molecular chaperone DnaJ